MKELSIEEKAKRFDEVVEEFRGLLEGVHEDKCDIMEEDILKIVHELKISEDERIRKELLEHCKNQAKPYIQTGNKCPQIQSWIAWLEKQSEQKPDDKVEPKFKVGDWVVDILYDKAMQVLFLEDDGYELDNGIWVPYTDAKERVHLWSIKDAKDGDVLVASDGSIFIFKEVDDNTCKHYIALTADKVIKVNVGLKHFWETSRAVHPATKEQRDLLFSKMKEAGYEWDAEKKGLEKIHVIDEGKAEIDYCFTKMMNGEKVSSVWTEEDEKMVKDIIAAIDTLYYHGMVNWLKSLKERVQCSQTKWKPSEEHIRYLQAVVNDVHNIGSESCSIALRDLLGQLKKL